MWKKEYEFFQKTLQSERETNCELKWKQVSGVRWTNNNKKHLLKTIEIYELQEKQ